MGTIFVMFVSAIVVGVLVGVGMPPLLDWFAGRHRRTRLDFDRMYGEALARTYATLPLDMWDVPGPQGAVGVVGASAVTPVEKFVQ